MNKKFQKDKYFFGGCDNALLIFGAPKSSCTFAKIYSSVPNKRTGLSIRDIKQGALSNKANLSVIFAI